MNAEELRLIELAKSGNLDAKHKLFEKYERLVNSQAEYYHVRYPHLEADDIRQEIYFRFEKCIDAYDPSYGVKFIGYFITAIRNYIPMLSTKSKTVTTHHTVFTYQRQQKYTGQKQKKFDKIKAAFEASCYNDGWTNEDGEEESTIASKYVDRVTPDRLADQNETAELINDALRFLPEPWKSIIEMSYGIGRPAANGQEIADKYGISRERIRQIKKKRLNRLDVLCYTSTRKFNYSLI